MGLMVMLIVEQNYYYNRVNVGQLDFLGVTPLKLRIKYRYITINNAIENQSPQLC